MRLRNPGQGLPNQRLSLTPKIIPALAWLDRLNPAPADRLMPLFFGTIKCDKMISS